MSWFHQALRSRRRWTRRSMHGSHCAVERARAGARYGIVITLPPLPFLLAPPPLLYQPVLLAPHYFISLSSWPPIALSACPAAPPPFHQPPLFYQPVQLALHCFISLPPLPVQHAPHCFVSLSSWPLIALSACQLWLSSCPPLFYQPASTALSAGPAGPSVIYQHVQLAPHCFISLSSWPFSDLPACPARPSLLY